MTGKHKEADAATAPGGLGAVVVGSLEPG